jgi:hypothetical protein
MSDTELHASDIRWTLEPQGPDDELDFELIFAEAEKLDNPLAIPLTAALQAIPLLRRERDAARIEAKAEASVRRAAVEEVARLTAQLDAARRTIAALRSKVTR